jgi:nanoRNase/pAp phosphatase (c-di-AMP/oligoRNAs hydrolase)
MSNLQQIIDSLKTYNTLSIIISDTFNQDTVNSASALYLGLTKLGKTVNLVSAKPVKPDVSIVANKFTGSLQGGGDNLVVSFPYEEGSVDKVDYAIQGNFFNLIIVPNEGFAKITPDDIRFTYAGGKTDAYILVDVTNKEQLGELYTSNAEVFDGQEVMYIGKNANDFATQSYTDAAASSTAELVTILLQQMQVDFDKDIATCLFNGVAWGTKNFTTNTTNADTFTLASTLLSLGAIRKIREEAPSRQQQPAPQQIAAQPRPQAQVQQQRPQQPQRQQQAKTQPSEQSSTNVQQSLKQAVLDQLKAKNGKDIYPEVIEDTPVQAEQTNWLKPKILSED